MKVILYQLSARVEHVTETVQGNPTIMRIFAAVCLNPQSGSDRSLVLLLVQLDDNMLAPSPALQDPALAPDIRTLLYKFAWI